MASFAIPLAMAGLSALGGIFGSKKQVSDTTSNSSTNPNYDPQTLAFKNFLMSKFQDSVSGLPSQGQYQTAGLKNIADSSANVNNSVNDILAARGLSRTTAGGAAGLDTGYQQGKNVSSFLTNSPFTYQQQIQPTLSNASAFLAGLPIGTTTIGSSHTVGTGGPTSPLAGGIAGGASGLAGYLGSLQASNSLGNILKSLGGGGSSIGLNPGSNLFSNTTGGNVSNSEAGIGFPFGGG